MSRVQWSRGQEWCLKWLCPLWEVDIYTKCLENSPKKWESSRVWVFQKTTATAEKETDGEDNCLRCVRSILSTQQSPFPPPSQRALFALWTCRWKSHNKSSKNKDCWAATCTDELPLFRQKKQEKARWLKDGVSERKERKENGSKIKPFSVPIFFYKPKMAHYV